VADKMATAAEEHEKEVEEAETKKRDGFLRKYLEEAFAGATDNREEMSYKTYQALVDKEEVCEEMCEILDMDKDELLAAWESFPKELKQT
ncbi:unnamed protein product, partial [Symbiodinium necroappetens]